MAKYNPIQDRVEDAADEIAARKARASWYAKRSGSGHGLVIDEATGDNIAVTYNEEDGPLVAAAPALLAACKSAVAHGCTLREMYEAIAKAEGRD